MQYKALIPLCLWGTFAVAAAPSEPPTVVTASALSPETGQLECEVGTAVEGASAQELFASTQIKPMPRPQASRSAKGRASTQGFVAPPVDGTPDGLIPADYVSPVTLVREEGHLRHEVDVSVSSTEDMVRLKQVLSFEAPGWARMMLVEFIPDDGEQQGVPGLFLRPNEPFVEGEFPEEPPEDPFDMTQFEVHAFNQAAYRSGKLQEKGMQQYLLITRDMDPAPAGKLWHVAIGQMRDDRTVSGTVRVRFSGSQYRAPLAVQLFYDVEEEESQVGFFDPTPREPTGDNPGTTQGEAMRWILFQAVEDLLEQLDFDGLYPVRILVTTHDNRGSGYVGQARTRAISQPAPNVPAPGRLRARQAGKWQEFEMSGAIRRDRRLPLLPQTLWERESGTDGCRALGGDRARSSFCRGDLGERVISEPGEIGLAHATISVQRDYEIQTGPNAGEIWRWDKNFLDRNGRPNITPLIKHEIMHAIGFSVPIVSQAYSAQFDPPRPLLDRPFNLDEQDQAWDDWYDTVTRRHFYGPITSPSEHNPWRHTAEPGPRLQDDGEGQNISSHLMFQEGDELAQWEEGKDFMRQSQRVRDYQPEVGVARDILLDVGYARGTWSIQDRRLPRHWYDPERSGHGLDFRRVEREDGSMQHFLHFYTYDEDGNPEWYIATDVLNKRAEFESTLDYVTWDDSQSPAAQVVPERSGTVRLDLDPPIDHPACAERRAHDPDGNEKWLFAVLEFDLPDGSGTWCLEPLQFGREPAFPQEGSGSWYAADPEDSGWGLSVMTRNYGPRPIINTVVYYYDADGEPTWAIGTEGASYDLPYGTIGNGVDIELLHVDGFCRTCEPEELGTTTAGTLQIQLNSQNMDADPNNQIVLLDVADQGPVGGNWRRENVGIKLLSSPHPQMSQ